MPRYDQLVPHRARTSRRPYRSRRLGVLAGVAATAGLLAAGTLAVPVGAAQPLDEAPELIVNGDFSAGTAPWWSTANSPIAVSDGRLCADVPAGTANAWDAIVGQNALALAAGESYTLSYSATSTVPVTIHTNVQMANEPWTTELATTQQVGTAVERVTETFTAGADHDAAQLAFQIGGSAEPFTFCVDDVSLRGGTAQPPYEPDTGSPVRVNQVGYLTHGPKAGTVVTERTDPLPWTLHSAAGTRVADGTTAPAGVDTASRRNVHTFDFSAVTAVGEGYTVTVDGERSEPFAIGDDLYATLRTDALAYFYHNRSGIEIDADIVGERYARPAGHLGVSPNQGDSDVPCRPGVCDYRLDARGGWYDAGDHGKYVVNGGISVAQLMAVFERTLYEETADAGPLGDGELRLPEHGNGTPDILDEARWELEFLMRMQVPAGEPLAGMATTSCTTRRGPGCRSGRTVTPSPGNCIRRPRRPPSTWRPPPPSAPASSGPTTRTSPLGAGRPRVPRGQRPRPIRTSSPIRRTPRAAAPTTTTTYGTSSTGPRRNSSSPRARTATARKSSAPRCTVTPTRSSRAAACPGARSPGSEP